MPNAELRAGVLQEERGPFDIHQYAEQVLRTLEERAPQPDAPMPFRELVKGGDRPQVARSFAAMLHLVCCHSQRMRRLATAWFASAVGHMAIPGMIPLV